MISARAQLGRVPIERTTRRGVLSSGPWLEHAAWVRSVGTRRTSGPNLSRLAQLWARRIRSGRPWRRVLDCLRDDRRFLHVSPTGVFVHLRVRCTVAECLICFVCRARLPRLRMPSSDARCAVPRLDLRVVPAVAGRRGRVGSTMPRQGILVPLDPE